MSKRNVNAKDNKNVQSAWDEAIADAKAKIKDFREAIRIYRKAKQRGEQWPEEVAGTKKSDSVPA